MREYSSTELANNTGDVLQAASQEAVEITRHGKPRFVLMSHERYERLLNGANPRRAVRVVDMDEAERKAVLDALDKDLEDE